MNLNLKTLAAGLDSDTFGWQTAKEGGIWVWRYYGQRQVREATYEEPAWYTDVESPYTLVRAEGYTVIICDEQGKELERLDFSDCFEDDDDSDDYGDLPDDLADAISQYIPWRDLQKEADEAYGEWLIARAEDREAA